MLSGGLAACRVERSLPVVDEGLRETGANGGSGSAELGGQYRQSRSRAAMLIRIRVFNEQLTGTEFTDQPRS
jgi:hypothetical protein